MLTEEDLSKAPYRVENSSHRKAIMTELERVKTLGMKPPQNLWEYKVSRGVQKPLSGSAAQGGLHVFLLLPAVPRWNLPPPHFCVIHT